MRLAVEAPAFCHVHEPSQSIAEALRAGLAVTAAARAAARLRHEAVGLGEGEPAGLQAVFLSGAEHLEFVPGVEHAGGQLRHGPAQPGAGEDPPGDDQIKGEHPREVPGGLEFASLGVASGPDHPVPFLNAPAAAVPPGHFPRPPGAGDGQIAQQHPLDGFHTFGRMGLVDLERPKPERRPARLIPRFGRLDDDLHETDFHLGLARLAAMAARHADGAGSTALRPVHRFPEPAAALEPAVVLRPDEDVQASRMPGGETPSGRKAGVLCNHRPQPSFSPREPSPVVALSPL
jgi:hypothetical protein